MAPTHLLIVGGGVIGLSIGITYLEQHPGCTVTLVAAEVAHKPATLACGGAGTSPVWPILSEGHSAGYASVWAGAHHVSAAGGDTRQLQWDQRTFAKLRALIEFKPWSQLYSACSNAHAQPLVWVEQVEVHDLSLPPKDWYKSLEWYPHFRSLDQEEVRNLPLGAQSGCTFTTIDIVVPLYLPWLRYQFEQLGGKIIQHKVDSLSEAVNLVSASSLPVTAVVNAAGTGARILSDVKDEACHPVRGQVLRVQAKECKSSIPRTWLRTPPGPHEESHVWNGQAYLYRGFSRTLAQGWRDVYIIPMGNGEFVIGGTRLPDDWDTELRPETTQQIIQRNLAVFPELSSNGKPGGVQINAQAVGQRPARQGGPNVSRSSLQVEGQSLPLVSAYGFGGSGFQASWGAAQDVVDLLSNGQSSKL